MTGTNIFQGTAGVPVHKSRVSAGAQWSHVVSLFTSCHILTRCSSNWTMIHLQILGNLTAVEESCRIVSKYFCQRNSLSLTSRLLWRSLSSMLGRNCDVAASNEFTADDFATFFPADKAAPPPKAGAVKCSPSAFHLLIQAEVRALIMMSPIKLCALDPVPTFLLREFVDLLLPYVTCMVNSSLRDAWVPDSQKHAVITLLLKWAGLDTRTWQTTDRYSVWPLCQKSLSMQWPSNFTSTWQTMSCYHTTSQLIAVILWRKQPCCASFLTHLLLLMQTKWCYSVYLICLQCLTVSIISYCYSDLLRLWP